MAVRIEAWCDGACSGNPGPGGWGAILIARDTATGAEVKRAEMSGGAGRTTNNAMELTAALAALQAVKVPARVHLHVDSNYVLHGFEKGWLRGWKRNGWMTSSKKPVANREMWEALDREVARHEVIWVKVKGHAGVDLNEAVDRLAVSACVANGGRQQHTAARAARPRRGRRR